MTVSAAVLATFEQLLNQAFRMDSEAIAHLEPMHGRVIKLEPVGLDFAIFLIPDLSGLQVYKALEGEPDCTLRGTPLDLARMRSSRESADQLFSGSVEITGDSGLAQRFGEVMSGLDIDWEEQLSHLTGDVISHELGNLARGLFKWGDNLRKTSGLNLQEYLQEELHLLPSRYEIEPFLTEIDQLRDDVERTSARIDRLRRQINASEPGL